MTKKLSAALFISTLAANSAFAATTIDFTGSFSPLNWTFTTTGTNGNLNTAGAPGTITISGIDGVGPGNIIYTIAAPADGMVSFDWSYTSFDAWLPSSTIYDPAGYIQNGSLIQLSVNGPTMNQNGSDSFLILAGQLMGFYTSTDNADGASSLTISNFEFTPSGADIPFGVDSTAGLAILGLASAWKFRRRRKA